MKKLITILFMNIIVIFTILAGCSVQNKTTESNAAKTKGTIFGNYPNRQIELVVPFAAGGGVDLAARAVADYLSKEWGNRLSLSIKREAEELLVLNMPCWNRNRMVILYS